jgi:hypothetical protein
MHSPQRHLEGRLKAFGGCVGNSAPSGSWEHVSNEFDGLPTILVRRAANLDVQATERLFAALLVDQI